MKSCHRPTMIRQFLTPEDSKIRENTDHIFSERNFSLTDVLVFDQTNFKTRNKNFSKKKKKKKKKKR